MGALGVGAESEMLVEKGNTFVGWALLLPRCNPPQTLRTSSHEGPQARSSSLVWVHAAAPRCASAETARFRLVRPHLGRYHEEYCFF